MAKHKWKNGMMERFLLFGVILIVLLVVAFIMSNLISERILVAHYGRSGHQILLQMKNYLDGYHENMENIMTNLGYSPTIVQYLKSEVPGQVRLQSDVLVVLGNTQLLQEDILGIALYDSEGKLLMEYGEEMEEDLSKAARKRQSREGILYYSDICLENGGRSCMVSMPVYDMDSWSYRKQIGACVLHLNIEGFQDMLDDMSLTDHSEIVITDRAGRVAAYMGSREAAPMAYDVDGTGRDGEYISNVAEAEGMEWKIASFIPKKDVQGQFNYLQYINMATGVVVVFLLSLFYVLYYRDIFRPVKSLVVFVQNHQKQPEARLSLNAVNELEILAGNLNQMLDEKSESSRREQEMKNRIYELEILQKQAELMVYQSQIDPHFLYNTLNCIQSMAYEYGADQVAEIILDLSRIFQYSVAGKGIVPLSQELMHVRQYADIMECRFMGRITVDIQAQQEVLDVKIPKFLLQPLVENAIIHGMGRRSQKGTVWVSAKAQGTDIRIKIADNGCGMSEEELHKLRQRLENSKGVEQRTRGTHGIGMVNIYQRLKLVYGTDADFQMESEKGKGTKILLLLPQEWEEMTDVQSIDCR